MAGYGKPAIFDSQLWLQFTRMISPTVSPRTKIDISMDANGATPFSWSASSRFNS